MNTIWREVTKSDCQSIHCVSGSPPESLQLTAKCRHPKWRLHFGWCHRLSLPQRECASDWHHGTFYGHSPLGAFSDWWHRPAHLPLITPQSWFIRLVSVTWHWHCPLLLLWKLPAGTFTIIWSPDGRTHQTETSAHTHPHTCAHTHTHTLPSHLTHTGPVLEGRWASHCLPLWKDLSPRGLSCLVGQRGKRLCKPAKCEELVWVCMKPIQHKQGVCARTHTNTVCKNLTSFSLPIYSLWRLPACQVLHKEIRPSGEEINI